MNLDSSGFISAIWIQLWQVTLLVVAVGVVIRVGCRHRPHLAYLLCILVAVKCLTPPVWSSPTGIFSWAQLQTVEQQAIGFAETKGEFPFVSETPVPQQIVEPGMLSAGVPIEAADETLAPAQPSISFTLIVTALWILGMLLLASVVMVRWFRCCRLLNRTRLTTEQSLTTQAEDIARRLGLRRKLRVVVTSSPLGPAVFGVFRPVVLLPKSILEGKSAEEIEPILSHELVHIRRGDPIVGSVQLLAQLVWWFHPLIWWANRQACRECERCCDQEVIAGLGCKPSTYARCLLEILTSKRRLQPVLGFPGMRHVQIMSNRLEDIMKNSHAFTPRTPNWCWVVTMAAAVLILPGAALTIQLAATAAPNEKTSKKYARDAVIAAVENLGGSVAIDEKAPGKPLIGIMLGSTNVTNDDLQCLNGLTSLRKLNLGWTRIGKEGLEHIQGLTNLEDLYLERCKNVNDTGLAYVKGLTNLAQLTISQTGVTDVGMEHLKDLKKLTWLDLTGLPITDEGAKHLHGLKNLKVLFFSRVGDNDLRPPLVTVEAVQKLKKSLPNCDIQHEPPGDREAAEAEMRRREERGRRDEQARDERIKQLIKTGFTVRNVEEAVDAIQQLPAAVGKLAKGASEVDRTRRGLDAPSSVVDLEEYRPSDKVVFVDLANLPINDEFVAHLRFLTDLEVLDLMKTPITDAALAYLKPLRKLRVLHVHGTNVTDAGLVHLKGLAKLEELWLLDTQVTDAGLVHLRGLANLKDLSLSGTHVSDAGLEQLTGLANLESLSLDGTKVSDAGVMRLKGLTKLRWLGLRRTKTTDSGVEALKAALPNANVRQRGP
ncbi:MAG: M56 family metallopeptidase [Planctomycetaceae bacterium]